jgi:hypothetical protein
MRHCLLLLIAVIQLSFLAAQNQTQQYLERLEPNLKPGNLKSAYLDYDFSSLIIPKRDFLGYIGSEYQRIKIFYTSVCKDSDNPENYFIEGISIVKNNKCDFSGTVKVKEVRERNSMEYGLDSKYKDAGFKAQGVMIAEYEFLEDKSQSHVGTFSGLMIIDWLVDKHGVIHLNDINWYSDNYRNNQHIGTWTPYGSDKSKTCNWGTWRIPFSGDLDIGTGEFYVNPKYEKNGWEFISAF